MGSFSEIASRLDQAEAERLAQAEQLAHAERTAERLAQAEAERLAEAEHELAHSGGSVEGSQLVLAPLPTPCSECGGEIPAGTYYLYVPGQGCQHTACAGGE